MDNLDNTNYLSNIRLKGYYTCFVLDDKTIVIEEEDYETYLEHVHEIEERLRKEQISDLYQDIAIKNMRKK